MFNFYHYFYLEKLKNQKYEKHLLCSSFHGIFFFDGSIGDLIKIHPATYDLEFGGYKLLGFSTDNWLTFYDENNNILKTYDASLTQEIRIYPNPTKDILHINWKSDVAKIQIYNLQGKKLMETTNESKVSIKNFPMGTYIAVVELANGKVFQKKLFKH